MVKGLYTAYTGMINEQKRLDVLSNNLANADKQNLGVLVPVGTAEVP